MDEAILIAFDQGGKDREERPFSQRWDECLGCLKEAVFETRFGSTATVLDNYNKGNAAMRRRQLLPTSTNTMKLGGVGVARDVPPRTSCAVDDSAIVTYHALRGLCAGRRTDALHCTKAFERGELVALWSSENWKAVGACLKGRLTAIAIFQSQGTY